MAAAKLPEGHKPCPAQPSQTSSLPVKSLASSTALVQVPGQAHSFIEHIQEGIAQAEADAAALVLFSGGQTRKAAGPRSEAEGYWLVAEAASWWGHISIRDRAFTEVIQHAMQKSHAV